MIWRPRDPDHRRVRRRQGRRLDNDPKTRTIGVVFWEYPKPGEYKVVPLPSTAELLTSLQCVKDHYGRPGVRFNMLFPREERLAKITAVAPRSSPEMREAILDALAGGSMRRVSELRGVGYAALRQQVVRIRARLCHKPGV